jgi:hypothetical protein
LRTVDISKCERVTERLWLNRIPRTG